MRCNKRILWLFVTYLWICLSSWAFLCKVNRSPMTDVAWRSHKKPVISPLARLSKCESESKHYRVAWKAKYCGHDKHGDRWVVLPGSVWVLTANVSSWPQSYVFQIKLKTSLVARFCLGNFFKAVHRKFLGLPVVVSRICWSWSHQHPLNKFWVRNDS